MTNDEERIRQMVEDMIREHNWADEEVQHALLEVARAHIWQQGLLSRLKYVINVAGFVGAVTGLILMLSAFFGWEFVRK